MSDQDTPAMDYPEHERTYEGFLKLSKITTLALGSIIWSLVMFGFGGGFGTFLGAVTLVAVTIAVAIGIASSGEGYMPSLVVFVISILFVMASTL